MSLNGALAVGYTGLSVSQAALDVVGNNMANAATEGFVRRSAVLATQASQPLGPGIFVGLGVKLQTVARHVDEALNARLRSSISDGHAAIARQEILTSLEVLENDLSDYGLSSRLTEFFNTWSDLANTPVDAGVRALVINEGVSLTGYIQDLRDGMNDIRTRVDSALRESVLKADSLLTQIATLNAAVVTGEAGGGGGSGPRDERDQLLSQLSELLEIQVVEQPSGSVDIFVESQPVVLAGLSRGLKFELKVVNNELEPRIRITADGSSLQPDNGRIGQLMTSRDGDIQEAIDDLDALTRQLMFELNNLHASGQGLNGFDSVTSFTPISDATIALNTGTNITDLPFVPVNGSFQLHVTQLSTNTRQTTLIPIDLDGVGADTSLNSLAAAINAVGNVSASVGADGRLTISSNSADFEFSFSDDSSHVLTALGVNTFFVGKGSGDIAVNQRLIDDQRLLATAQGHLPGDNRNALAINALIDKPLPVFNGTSLRDNWRDHVQTFASRTAQINQDVEATSLVSEGLEAQRQSVSGVNIDEEAIDLIRYQRAFQGSARFITVIDELMGTVINLLR